jgi:mannose-1-phosphate guanylyltransferase/mannose-6-phosphate isomerase
MNKKHQAASLPKIIPVILAGGGGKRLFPLSTKQKPKYLLKINSLKTLLEETIERALKIQEKINKNLNHRNSKNFPIVLVANIKQKKAISSITKKFRKVKILEIYEPLMKNTAPAICFAAKKILEKFGDCIMFVMPSDHKIEGDENFLKAAQAAYEAAKQNFIATFGIVPTHPETGYGYIKVSKDNPLMSVDGVNIFKAERFTEKPTREKAEDYLKSGEYFWNSGIFAFKSSVILDELRKFTKIPETFEKYPVKKAYAAAEEISIDYAVCEKSDKIVCIPANFRWSDIGSFKAIKEFYKTDEKGNAGNAIFEDSENSLVIRGEENTNKQTTKTKKKEKEKKIILFGVKDLAVVEAGNFLVVFPLDKNQDIKKLAEEYDK